MNRITNVIGGWVLGVLAVGLGLGGCSGGSAKSTDGGIAGTGGGSGAGGVVGAGGSTSGGADGGTDDAGTGGAAGTAGAAGSTAAAGTAGGAAGAGGNTGSAGSGGTGAAGTGGHPGNAGAGGASGAAGAGAAGSSGAAGTMTLAAIPGQDPAAVDPTKGAPFTNLGPSFAKSALAGNSIVIDPSGDILIGLSNGSSGATISKVDTTFTQIWSLPLTTLNVLNGVKIATDSVGDAFLGGEKSGAAVVAKVLPNGTLSDYITVGGTADFIQAVAIGPQDSLFAIGSGNQLPNTAPGGGGFLAQYNSAGTLLQLFQSTSITYPFNALNHSTPTFFVDSTGAPYYLMGQDDIVKANATFGANEWNQHLVGVSNLALTPDGTALYTTEQGAENPTTLAIEFNLNKRDPSTGAIVWRRPFGTATATLNAVEQKTWTGAFVTNSATMLVTSDAIYLAGLYTNTYKNGSTPIPSNMTGYVDRLDLTGQQQWFRQIVSSTNPALPNADTPLATSALAITGTQLLVYQGGLAFFLNATDGTGP